MEQEVIVFSKGVLNNINGFFSRQSRARLMDIMQVLQLNAFPFRIQ